MAILLAGLSALMYGAADFCGGLASRRTPLFTVLVFSQTVGLLIAVSAALAFRQGLPAPADLLWGAAAGLCGAAGLAALYRALATTLVAVASPVAAVTGTIIPVLLGLALGERPGASRMGRESGWPCLPSCFSPQARWSMRGRGSSAVPCCWGPRQASASGCSLLPFPGLPPPPDCGRLRRRVLATITLVVFAAVLTRRSLRPAQGGFLIVLLCGALDMGANIAFLLATRIGLLSITAVVTSLYPGPTVLLALLVFRERLTVPRVLGLTLALAGVALHFRLMGRPDRMVTTMVPRSDAKDTLSPP